MESIIVWTLKFKCRPFCKENHGQVGNGSILGVFYPGHKYDPYYSYDQNPVPKMRIDEFIENTFIYESLFNYEILFMKYLLMNEFGCHLVFVDLICIFHSACHI